MSSINQTLPDKAKLAVAEVIEITESHNENMKVKLILRYGKVERGAIEK